MFGVHHTASRRFDVLHADARLLPRFLDFTVLAAAFYLSFELLSVELEGNFLFHSLSYSTILSVFMSLSRRTVVALSKSIGDICCQILGNAIGILIGTCFVWLLAKIVLARGDISVAVILSGIMAFFVLGTLCPFVYKAPLAKE